MVREARRRPGEADAFADDAHWLTAEALQSLTRRDHNAFLRNVADMADRPGVPGWALATGQCLAERLRRGIATAWERGWEPADVVRFASRRLTARHGRLATDTIADQLRTHARLEDRWRAQLTTLDASIWWEDDDPHPAAWCAREQVDHTTYVRCAVELVHLLESLPRLPGMAPRQGAPHPTESTEVDQRMLGKVRALLSKAESTEFPEEAEALSARAQELMTRHSIDHALIAGETGNTGGPAGRRIAVDNPYEAAKAVLLTVVADANRCRAIWHRELGFSTVLGFPADLAAVEVLFTSLLVQATSAMLRAGPRRDARGRSRTRSFRHAFLNAYATRIGERLKDAASRAAADAGGKDLLPVLAARDRAVEQVVGTMFPNLVKGRSGSVSNYEGWVAGRAAADLASLDGRHEVSGAVRRS